jgi:DNA-binding Lrp family transcriptional regulator
VGTELLDQRLIAALQCDGRLSAEQAGEALGLPTRVVLRRWAALFARGDVRVVATTPRPALRGVTLLRIRVLRGKVDAVAAALAERDDIPLVELSASGDQVIAVHLADPTEAHRLVFRQLPATTAVTSVDAQTVIHVFADDTDWTLDVLTTAERAALTRHRPSVEAPALSDPLDLAIAEALGRDGRASAAAVAHRVDAAESTVRRRVAALLDSGQLLTRVVVEPAALGLTVDASLRMQVSPGRLDATGRALAAHPAVHGALVTTGPANLYVAVWLRDLDHLYEFITVDLADLGVTNVDTVLIGANVKRPTTGW